MHGKNLLIDDRGNGQIVKAISESFPQFDVVSAFAFIIEAVYPINTGTFMVATQDEEIFRVFYLIGKQQANCFERLFTSVYIVAKEEVICFWREAAIFKQSKEVIILTMDVAADLDWGFELEEDGLVDKNVTRFCTEILYFIFLKLDGLPRAVALIFQQPVNDRVKIDLRC